MRAVDIIDKKKKRQELTKEEIDFLLEGYLAGTIPDYQMSAFLMAVYFNNMTKEELTYFTLKCAIQGTLLLLIILIITWLINILLEELVIKLQLS